MQRLRRLRVVRAIGEPFIARPHVWVSDQRRDLARRERGEIRFAVVARIGGEQRVARAECGERVDDRQQ